MEVDISGRGGGPLGHGATGTIGAGGAETPITHAPSAGSISQTTAEDSPKRRIGRKTGLLADHGPAVWLHARLPRPYHNHLNPFPTPGISPTRRNRPHLERDLCTRSPGEGVRRRGVLCAWWVHFSTTGM